MRAAKSVADEKALCCGILFLLPGFFRDRALFEGTLTKKDILIN
jgi:hypothetical protein